MRLYHYTVLGALCQLEFPEEKTKPGAKEGDPPEATPFARATPDRGALHLKPNSSLYLTEDELEVIAKKHPGVLKHLRGPLDAEPKAEEKDAAAPAQAGSNDAPRDMPTGAHAGHEDGPPLSPPVPAPPARGGKRGGHSDE